MTYITEGEKTIEFYTVDGIDSLGYLTDSIIKCKDYYYIFYENTKSGDPNAVHFFCVNLWTGTGEWDIKKFNTILRLRSFSIDGYWMDGDWRIVELTKEVIHLKKEGNKIYELKFVTR